MAYQTRKKRRNCWLALGLSLILLLAGLGKAGAQSIRPDGLLDSLQSQLRTQAPTDTARVLTLYQLSWYYTQSDLGKSRDYGLQGLTLARRLRYLKGEIQCLYQLGNVANIQQDNLQGIRYYQQALRLANQRPTLVRFSLAALEGLANLAMTQKSYGEARRYFLQSIALGRQHPARVPSYQLEEGYTGMMTLYLNQLADGSQADSIVSRADYWARRALPLARQDQNPSHVGLNLIALALVQERRQRPDSTRLLLRQALALQPVEDAPADAANLYYTLAGFEQRQGNHAAALQAGLKALALARSMQDPGQEADIDLVLGQAYTGLGQDQAAYRAAAAANRIRDSIITANNQATIARLQVQFDTERKESHIRELTREQQLQQAVAARQRQRLWTLAAVLATVLAGLGAVAVLALRLRRSRAQLAAQNTALAQARATQDRLYSIIAHDLRSPLIAFTGLANMVSFYRQQGDFQALEELTGEVRDTAGRLTALLDNLLHWAAAQTGELSPHPETLAAAELLEETAELYAPDARARQVSLRVDVDPALPALHADRNMTLAILRNLVGNALKVVPAGSAIELLARPATGGVELLVRDAGSGLSPAQVQAVLSQEPAAGRPGGRVRGTGLGLPLVRRLTALQGGQFRFKSTLGVGTTVSITLPAAGAGT